MRFLSTIVIATNWNLQKDGHYATTSGEILKYFGVLILMARFEFSDRGKSRGGMFYSNYVPAPNFANFMPRKRFEAVRRNVTYRKTPILQQYERRHMSMGPPPGRWGLIQDFVDAISEHRSRQVRHSTFICVDESISRWYGLGGHWIGGWFTILRGLGQKA